MKNKKSMDAMKHELQEMEAYKKVYKQYSLRRFGAEKHEQNDVGEDEKVCNKVEEKVNS